MPETVQLIDPQGRPRDVPLPDVAGLLAQPGWHQQAAPDTSRLTTEAAREQDYGGTAGAAKAILYGAGRGLSLGGTDVAARLIGGEQTARDIRGYKDQHPELSIGSEVVGGLVPALAAPGSLLAKTPAGQVSRIGREIVETAAESGVAKRAATAAVGAGVEGGLYGGGSYLSQVAIEDKPLAAEGFFGAMGKGALWGAPIGGALSLGGDVLIRAKSLFPKHEVTKAAAQAIDREATDALSRAVADGDQMLALARQKIARVDANAGAAQSAERATRTLFGAADPVTLENQVGASTDKTKLTEAVDNYSRAKTQLDEWAAVEADPDLERALLRLRPPSVQVGGQNLRVAEFGEVVPPLPIAPELGEFGLQRTSVGKGLARGTPGPHDPPVLPRTEELPPLPLASSLDEPAQAVAKVGGLPDLPRPAVAESTRVGKRPEGLPEMPSAAAAESAGTAPARQTIEQQFDDVMARLRGEKDVPTRRRLQDEADELMERMELRGVGDESVTASTAPATGPAQTVPGAKVTDLKHPDETAENFVLRRMREQGEAFGDPEFNRKMGERKVFLGSLGIDWSVPENRALMLKMMRQGDAQFARADLVGAMDPAMVKASEITDKGPGGFGGESWHFIKDTGQPVRPVPVAEIAPGFTSVSKDEHAAFRDAYKAKLTSREALALGEQTKNVGYDVNNALRRNAVAKSDRAHIESLDSALAKASTERPIRVYRGLVGEEDNAASAAALDKFYADMKPGDRFRDRAYASTAIDIDDARRGPIILEVDVPAGYQAAAVPSKMSLEDGEILLRRDTIYEYTGSRKAKYTDMDGETVDELIVSVRVVPGGEPRPVAFVNAKNARPKHDAIQAIEMLPRSAPSATDTLTGQMRSMQSRLAAGEDLSAMGAPARQAYAAQKAEKTAAAATKARGSAIEAHEVPEYGALKAHEKKTDSDLARTIPARKIAERGYYEPPGGGSDATRAGNAQKAIREGQREAVSLTVTPSGKIAVVDGRHRLAAAIEQNAPIKVKWSTGAEPSEDMALRGGRESGLESLVRAQRDAGAPTGLEDLVDAQRRAGQATAVRGGAETIPFDFAQSGGLRFDPKTRTYHNPLAAVVDDAKAIVGRAIPTGIKPIETDAIQAALRKHAGKNVDIGTDLGRAARAIGDVESALAQLAEALGPDAPASALAHAKSLATSNADQVSKMGSNAANLAQELRTRVKPVIDAQKTVVDDAASKALAMHDAREAAKVVKAEGAAAAAAAAQGAERKGGLLGVAADIGTALEVLNAMGVRVPDVSSIPVIGPVLSMYLKARAVLGILGRKGGSIGRSADGLVAAKSAAVRDRVNAATRSLLDAGAKGAKRAAPIAGPAGALGYQLFPGDGETKSKDARKLYAARMDELARAQAPGAIEQAVADRIRVADPDLQAAITQQARTAISFLASKAREGSIDSMLPGDGKWHVSRAKIEEFARYAAAVHDPAGVLEDLARGHVSAEAAEVLKVVYPSLYAEAQRILLEHAPEFRAKLPYPRRVSISIMFGVPVDGTMSPSHMQFLAKPGAQQQAAPAPGGAPPPQPLLQAPLQIGRQTMTSFERRAGV